MMAEDQYQPENQSEHPEAETESISMEQRDPEIVREISLEEYQPKGTLTLTLIYFVIIVLMWIFMYFVEFAGNAPSIIN